MGNGEKAELANRLCDSGKFQEALKLFKELVHNSKDPAQKAGYLIDAATCYAHNGDAQEVSAAVSKARMLVSSDPVALAQIDFFQAILLIEDGQREEGQQALSREFILSLQSGSSGPPASYKYKMLAVTHRKLGEYSQARRYEDLAQLKEPQ